MASNPKSDRKDDATFLLMRNEQDGDDISNLVEAFCTDPGLPIDAKVMSSAFVLWPFRKRASRCCP